MENQGQADRALKRELAKLREQLSELELSKSRLEQELRILEEGKAFYRQMVDRSADGMCVLVDERFAFANHAMARILGVGTPEELSERNALDFVEPAYRERVMSQMAARLEKGKPNPLIEARIVRADKTVVDVEMATNPLRYHGTWAIEMMVRDISELSRVKLAQAELEQKVAERTAELRAENEKLTREIADHDRAREALRETEERFRAIFENAQDLIFTKDRSRRYTMVNPAMEKLHGRKASQILGLRAEDFMAKETAKRIETVDIRVLAGETVEEEYVTPIKGVPTAFHGIRVPLKDAAGDISGMCGVVRNITERRQAARAAGVPAGGNYPSEAMRITLRDAGYAAPTDSIVLLLGESGCGKDYLARWIHDRSPRATGAFFAINCAAVAKELAESELFGHEAGAFTGARGAKKGLLQLAEGGTLLLNEIGELALPLQSKLLTFLDTKSFLRVGGEQSVRVDARIIAATHRNLQHEVAEGRFLSALYYRLNVVMIRVPPLRERTEDIPIIADEIMSSLAAEMQRSDLPVLDAAAIEALSQYDWPGNVRELRNVLERALMLWDGGPLDLGMPLRDRGGHGWTHKVRFPANRSLHEVADEFRRSICEEALRRTGGSKTEAARLLSISRGALYRYMKGGAYSRDSETYK